MCPEEIQAELEREPFIPLRIHHADGSQFEVPFRGAARILTYGVMVFTGIKGLRQSEGYEVIAFDKVARIEHCAGPAREEGSADAGKVAVLRDELNAALRREPFLALRLHLIDGRKLDVPTSRIAIFQRYGIMLFKSVEQAGSRVAEGYEHVAFDEIDRIEQMTSGGGKRKKAS